MNFGYIGEEKHDLKPGTKIDLSCKQSYYLYGENSSTCMANLTWSNIGKSKCLTPDQFRRKCYEMEKDGQKYMWKPGFNQCVKREVICF